MGRDIPSQHGCFCSIYKIHLSIYPSIHLSIYIYLSIYLSIDLSIYLSIYLSILLDLFGARMVFGMASFSVPSKTVQEQFCQSSGPL